MTSTAATVARWFTLLVAAFLLLSMGGAGILAAPATLPLLYVASATTESRSFRITATVIAALTGVEAGFGLACVSVGFGSRYWWTFSVLLGLAVAAAFGRLATRAPSVR